MPGNYPDYTDPFFNQKIFEKRESKFNMTEPLSTDADLETESAKRCGDFRLSNTQKFLKSFMNGESPYRSLLLYHGTGTGKTCSSISIAEQFSEELERNHKKIIVVLNPSIQENFRKNIFNIQKYKSKRVNQQCLRDKYLKMIKSKKISNDEELMKKINRKINILQLQKQIINHRYQPTLSGPTAVDNQAVKLKMIKPIHISFLIER